MFRLEQAYINKTKICSDCPSGPPKCQICSDWPIRPQKMSNLFDWPQNYHFCMAKCKYTNKQCHNSFPSETGYFLPAPILSLSFHSWRRELSGVSMMMEFWGVIGGSKYPVCKTINKWEIENSSSREVAPQSWIIFESVYTIFIWPTESRKDVPMI